MAGDKRMQRDFQNNRPRTYIALQKLVLSMAKVVKYQGKKTWLGRDRGISALHEFTERLSEAITAMTLEGRVNSSDESFDIECALLLEVMDFADAHPNWQDAYEFFYFFTDMKDTTYDSVAIIERARRF